MPPVSGVESPRLTIDWLKGRTGLELRAGEVFPGGAGLSVGHSHFLPEPQLVHEPEAGRSVVVVGAPLLGERIDVAAVARRLFTARSPGTVLAGINGQFLLILLDARERTLWIASDRYNSYPLYWAEQGDRFLASFSYLDLLRRLSRGSRPALLPESLFEFICLQRMLGTRTHDARSACLPPAALLRVSADGTELSRYWRPDFTWRRDRGTEQAARELAERLRTSLRRQTSDGRNYGLFLSGGHDSRTILAAAGSPPVCYTVAFSDNYEVACARRLAREAGAAHRFLRLEEDHFERHLDLMSWIGEGMYAPDHALFVGLRDRVARESDVVLHGHGLDYMFQGMYLPARTLHLFGRPTFFQRLQRLPDDLAGFYLEGIAYRLKHVDLWGLLRQDWRGRMRDHLLGRITQVLEEGRDVCRGPWDAWEYLQIHALGRHYSRPNIVSKMTCAEVRTPTFDNDLFDFYLSLPPRQRLSARVLRRTLKLLNPALARIPTGNYGMPAGASPAYKTAYLIGRKALRHLTGNPHYRAPHAEDRTWPDRDHYIVSHAGYRRSIREAVVSAELEEALPMFDWPRLRVAAQGWMERPSGGGALLVSLLGLYRFLRMSA